MADRITILRDGTRILTDEASNLDEEKVIFAMVGRALVHGKCPDRTLGETVLTVKNLNVEEILCAMCLLSCTPGRFWGWLV